MEALSASEWVSGFGYNAVDVSDRVLRLEIAPNTISELGAADLKLKTIHVSYLMLASKSHFFFKLFENGMRETDQRDEVALKINESEEAAFMDLLKFIYEYSLNANSSAELVDVLLAAEKYEVPSCVTYAADMLLKLPMSTDSAVVYLGLPPSVLADEVVQTLVKSAKKYICDRYRNFKKFQEEGLGLPVCAVEIVIGSDGLKVVSEDDVFDFILKWGRHHYPELEARREILTELLASYVCMPKMSSLKLKEVIDCADIDSEKVWRPVLDAVFSKDPNICTDTAKYNYPSRVYIQYAMSYDLSGFAPYDEAQAFL